MPTRHQAGQAGRQSRRSGGRQGGRSDGADRRFLGQDFRHHRRRSTRSWQTNLLALNAAVRRRAPAKQDAASPWWRPRCAALRNDPRRPPRTSRSDHHQQRPGRDGVKLVNQAGRALAEIVDSIKEVAGVVAGIAAASSGAGDQDRGGQQSLVADGRNTQENSALVEENAATAKTLEDQAAAMADTISFLSGAGARPTERQGWGSRPAMQCSLAHRSAFAAARIKMLASIKAELNVTRKWICPRKVRHNSVEIPVH